ncbi:MAG: serine hydrolase domain-containing protein, partial [Acidobacteriota bacterium]
MHYLKIALLTLAALVLWTVLVVYGALDGWWLRSMAPAGDATAFMDAAIERIERDGRGNLALVLIEDGEVFDEHFAFQDQEIDRDTLFPTASLSKWITAWVVLGLAQDGRLDLDRPVSTYLTRWSLPPSDFDNDGVTGRTLLSHTAGLADGLGFGDYLPGETVPSVEASLANPRASSGEEVAIAVARPPGSEWQYSGGGYLILELLVEEITGQSFEDHVRSAFLDPLGMSRSTYDDLDGLDNVTVPYDAEGRAVTHNSYASKAATGLASTAADLTTLVLAQLNDPASLPGGLDGETVRAMREPHGRSFGADIWGLGTILYAPTGDGDHVYGHDGQNEPAVNAAVRIHPGSRDGILVLTSGRPSMATDLGFEWVAWQTGLPDVLGFGGVIEEAIRIVLGGGVVILVLGV